MLKIKIESMLMMDLLLGKKDQVLLIRLQYKYLIHLQLLLIGMKIVVVR